MSTQTTTTRAAIGTTAVVREYRIQPVRGRRFDRLMAALRGRRPAERVWHWQPVTVQEASRVDDLRGQAAMLLAAR